MASGGFSADCIWPTYNLVEGAPLVKLLLVLYDSSASRARSRKCSPFAPLESSFSWKELNASPSHVVRSMSQSSSSCFFTLRRNSPLSPSSEPRRNASSSIHRYPARAREAQPLRRLQRLYS